MGGSAQALTKLREKLEQVDAELVKERLKREKAEKNLLAQEEDTKQKIEEEIRKQVDLSSKLQSCITENESLKAQVKSLSDTTEKSAIENLTDQITSEIEERKWLLTDNEELRYVNHNLIREVDRLKEMAKEVDSYRDSAKEKIRQAEREARRANAAHSPDWMREKMAEIAAKEEDTYKTAKRLEREIARLTQAKENPDQPTAESNKFKEAPFKRSNKIDQESATATVEKLEKLQL